MPRLFTSASPLSLMLSAMRVKSPFSHRAWFGFAEVVVIAVSLLEWLRLGVGSLTLAQS